MPIESHRFTANPQTVHGGSASSVCGLLLHRTLLRGWPVVLCVRIIQCWVLNSTDHSISSWPKISRRLTECQLLHRRSLSLEPCVVFVGGPRGGWVGGGRVAERRVEFPSCAWQQLRANMHSSQLSWQSEEKKRAKSTGNRCQAEDRRHSGLTAASSVVPENYMGGLDRCCRRLAVIVSAKYVWWQSHLS